METDRIFSVNSNENESYRVRKGLDLMESMDINKYATKKTIAQGLLNVALLSANASQLKYVLQVGERHAFYTVILSLISISIVLQVIQACLCIHLASGLNINKQGDCRHACKANNIILCLNCLITVVNILIGAFEICEFSRSVTKTPT